MIDSFSCTHFISERRFFDNAVTSIVYVRHIVMTVAFNDVIMFSDVNLNDGVRYGHYKLRIPYTWEFSIFILPWMEEPG